MEALIWLRQTSSVAEYTSQFEALSNRLQGISEKKKKKKIGLAVSLVA
jgi:hypothetical protein